MKEFMKNKFLIVQILIFLFVNSLMSDNVQRVWIFFKDKGQIESKNVEGIAKQHLSERSIARRAQKSSPIKYDFTDLPVNQIYVTELKNKGITIIHKSKWLNAVSAFINDIQYKEFSNLDFVKKIVPVKSFKFNNNENQEKNNLLKPTNFDYGGSFCASMFIIDKECGLDTLMSEFSSSYRICIPIGHFVFAKAFKRGYFYDSQ